MDPSSNTPIAPTLHLVFYELTLYPFVRNGSRLYGQLSLYYQIEGEVFTVPNVILTARDHAFQGEQFLKQLRPELFWSASELYIAELVVP